MQGCTWLATISWVAGTTWPGWTVCSWPWRWEGWHWPLQRVGPSLPVVATGCASLPRFCWPWPFLPNRPRLDLAWSWVCGCSPPAAGRQGRCSARSMAVCWQPGLDCSTSAATVPLVTSYCIWQRTNRSKAHAWSTSSPANSWDVCCPWYSCSSMPYGNHAGRAVPWPGCVRIPGCCSARPPCC